MSRTERRIRDILSMAVAIQLTVVGTVPEDGSLIPLFFVGVLITAVVIVREAARRVGEYTDRRERPVG